MAKIQPQSVGLAPELPRHIGIIMDGNGRYATRRGLPRKLGHRAGMEDGLLSVAFHVLRVIRREPIISAR